ncbi:TonB-dependent receptor [Sphingomonas sp. MMS24-J13]|uniref:TonB-dependent receptor n=1 Tax=Sphingomonas sp. MMS24-J13 TaxID=3238686 RepID=UPI00384BF819
MSVDAALARLLASTPFTARMVAPATYRLVRRPPPAPPPRSRSVEREPLPSRLTPTPIDIGSGDIVVRGAKREISLALYPGSVTVIPMGDDAWGADGGDGQSFLLRQTPMLQSTELGSGRNKLFIRGVADSSFTGPTQATAGTYFGDVRTGYNGPDPNLNLYDLDRVEILEGPQGALYGAGSIGGIIRLSPRPPSLDGATGSIDMGTTATSHGAIGYDLAAMLNLAPWEDHGAIRLVGYRNVQGGYIDDPGRGLSNINGSSEVGGRVSIRLRPIYSLTIDASGIIQKDRQSDLQYALIEDPPLTRRSAIPQPFKDNYKLGRLVITKTWDSGLSLVSATGRVIHQTDQRYDATRPGFPMPVAYDEHNTIKLTTQEVRLSRELSNGRSWLIGASYVHDVTGKDRQYGFLATPRDLIGVTNRTEEQSVFASSTQRLGPALSITGGVRYTHARMDGDPSTVTRSPFIRGRSSSRVDPEVALSLRLARNLTLFSQYQQGFRTGGLAVAPGAGRVATYEDDKIKVGEIGLRLVRRGATGLAAVGSVSYARWNDIQADLVSLGGFPYTANVGNGRILSFEGSFDWIPIVGLKLTGAVFVNRSRLVDPLPGFVASGSRPLPDTPGASATMAAVWSHKLHWGDLGLEANARYVGASRLGVGPVLDLPYGRYWQTGAAAKLGLKPFTLSLTVDNILNTRGNRFAIGNPFGVAFRDEITPLRPRTFRLGIKRSF